MAVTFIETPVFRRLITGYLSDEGVRALQNELLLNPEKGTPIRGSGGLRKVRFADPTRGKGKRSGLRVIYYRRPGTVYLLLVYDKDTQDDLTPTQLKVLRGLIEE